MTNEEHQALLEAVRVSNANWVPSHTSLTDLEPQERHLRLGYNPGPDEGPDERTFRNGVKQLGWRL